MIVKKLKTMMQDHRKQIDLDSVEGAKVKAIRQRYTPKKQKEKNS